MKRVIYLAAFGLIGSMGIVGCNRSEEPPATASNQNPSQNTVNNTTTRPSDMAQTAKNKTEAAAESVMTDDAAIRESLASVVDDAMSKNSVAGIAQFLTDAGRTQIGDASKTDYADLDNMVATLQKDWKAKYGDDFKLTMSILKDDNTYNISSVDKVNNGQSKTEYVASFNIAAGTHSSAMAVPMRRDGMLGSWRIDVPTTLTAQSLHDSLLRALTEMQAAEPNWPTDQNAAYRIVTRHILSAILDKQM